MTSSQGRWRLVDAGDPPLSKRVQRIDVTAKAFFADGRVHQPALAELAFAADRSLMLIGRAERVPACSGTLGQANFGFTQWVMAARLQAVSGRAWAVRSQNGVALEGEQAVELGLVTFAYEDFDWDDELRVMIEERASHSPDSLTGMEANLRFAGPETMETKIFGRLTAWQNWIFQRPNSVGEQGALKLYGSGVKATFDKERV
jgi:benzoyl-CoA-dihydrodiol lyase